MPQVNNGKPSYGEMFVNDATLELPLQDTPVSVGNIATGTMATVFTRNISANAGTAEFTIKIAGWYKCHMTASLNANKLNTLHGDFRLEGSPFTNAIFERGLSASGQVGDVSAKGSVYAMPGEVINFTFETNVATAPTLNLQHFNMDIREV